MGTSPAPPAGERSLSLVLHYKHLGRETGTALVEQMLQHLEEFGTQGRVPVLRPCPSPLTPTTAAGRPCAEPQFASDLSTGLDQLKAAGWEQGWAVTRARAPQPAGRSSATGPAGRVQVGYSPVSSPGNTITVLPDGVTELTVSHTAHNLVMNRCGLPKMVGLPAFCSSPASLSNLSESARPDFTSFS